MERKVLWSSSTNNFQIDYCQAFESVKKGFVPERGLSMIEFKALYSQMSSLSRQNLIDMSAEFNSNRELFTSKHLCMFCHHFAMSMQ